MIYTLTFNPSLDYIMQIPDYISGMVNRSTSEQIHIGGKGINVSVVLKNLGLESAALGFCGGFTGDFLVKTLYLLGISCNFIRLDDGFTRINVKLKSDIETEINGKGPEIDKTAILQLFEKLNQLKNGDTLVLAGSAPGLIYSDIMELLKNKKIDTVVDATGELLTSTLKYRPLLIKPNNFELEEIFGCKLSSRDEIIECAKKLQYMGAKNVLVSLGRDGAVLAAENGSVMTCDAPMGKVINSTGAGDSSVAGFIYGYHTTGDLSYALKLAVSAGSATAFSQNLATKEEIMRIFEKI